jgi:hypothetical protein
MGIIEMGRLLFAFSVVSNAAQEGSRYAITRPRDYINQAAAATRIAMGTAIPTQLVVSNGSCNIYDNARQEVWGISPANVSLNVNYETASGTSVAIKDINNDPNSANYYKTVIREGNRVVVEAVYKFDFIVPLISRFAPDGINVKMSSARSILNNGEGTFNCTVNYIPAPVPPSPTNTTVPSSTSTASNTPTRTATVPTATKTATAVFTSTPTNTATNTATKTATPTNSPEAKLKFASIDVGKWPGPNNNNNNRSIDIVVYVVDQNGAYVPDAVVTFSGVSTVGQTDSGVILPVFGSSGRYQICNEGNFSGDAGSVTVTVKATKAGYQEANGSATNKMGAICNTTPTSTSTPTKTATPTLTPSNTPTSNASVTSTNTPLPTNTFTPTPPPTLTPYPTSTPTPVACPYSVSISAYKAPLNQRPYVKVQVTDALGRKVAGAKVSAVIRGEVRTGTTDSAGSVCLVFNKYQGNSVPGSVTVSGPECSVPTQAFTTTTSGAACQ